jgi:uncharacterized protein YegJ (DUF2314 family)
MAPMPKLFHAHLLSAALACFVSAFIAVSAVAAPPGATPGEPVPAGSPVAGPIHFQFALYYPARPAMDPMTALRGRVAKLDGAPKLAATMPAPASVREALVFANWNTTTVQKEYRPPSMDMLQRFGYGVSREEAEALQGADKALILDFAHQAPQARTALFKATELALQVARDTNGLLWDEETRELFTPDEWRKRRIDSWENGIPNVADHTTIHAYRNDNMVRAITLGMAKFGLPDVVVSDFSWSSSKSMGSLVVMFSQAMVEGASLAHTGQYELDPRAIRHAGLRNAHLANQKANAAAAAKLSLVNGKWESGDPQNRLYEIQFDRYLGIDRYARQTALLNATFGAEEDSVTRLQHNDEVLAASKVAVARLPELRKVFNRGLQPGEYILVKASFARRGGNEWMWVEVSRWSGMAIDGLLKNEPVDVPGLHAGQMVKVSQVNVFDYIRRFPDGREEGNETGKIIKRMQSKK